MSFGNCGYAFPTIIGAKVAAPDRPAIAYVGDGAWGMSMGEMQTCVRHDIPVTAVVFHNRQWGAEKKNQVDFYNRRFVGVDSTSEPSGRRSPRRWAPKAIVIDKLKTSARRCARRPTRRARARRRSSRSCAPASWATRSAAMRWRSRCATSRSTSRPQARR